MSDEPEVMLGAPPRSAPAVAAPIAPTTPAEHLAIGVGAVVGVLLRYGVGRLSGQHVPTTFPIGTLAINLGGCLVIGALQTLFLEYVPVRREIQLALVVGGLGGFTTFSTFAVEVVQLVGAGRVVAALGYALASLVGGLVLALAGRRLVLWGVALRRGSAT